MGLSPPLLTSGSRSGGVESPFLFLLPCSLLPAPLPLLQYISERRREFREVSEMPGEEAQEVAEIFRAYGLSDEQSMPLVKAIEANPIQWINFMMRFDISA